MRILFRQHFLDPALAEAVPVLVINYSVFVAFHCGLPFSNLSSPPANEPIPQNPRHFFSLLFKHQDGTGVS